MWKSVASIAVRSADCRRYDGVTAIYVHCTETIWSKCLVTWYASLAKTNARSTYRKGEGTVCACVPTCAGTCMERACTTRGRGPIKSNAIVVTIPVRFPMLFPGKPRKPKNTISIQS